jgi:hypothetical protein
LEGVLDDPEVARAAPVALAPSAEEGEVSPPRGDVAFSLCLSPRPWLNIKAPLMASATSMIRTMTMRVHGLRATIGIEIEGSSRRGAAGRDEARRGLPLGA